MSRQRTSRESRKDDWRYIEADNDMSSMLENETEDYTRAVNDNSKRQTTSSDSPFDYPDVRPRSSTKRGRSPVREKDPYELKSTMSMTRTKSVLSLESKNPQRHRRRSGHRRNGTLEKSADHNDDAKRQSNKTRRSSLSKISDNDNSLKRKKRRKRYGSSDRGELPITDILKRAQESRTKYEEPILLPELTTDTIYVQSRNGFSAVKVAKEHGGSRKEFEVPEECDSRPIKVAIIMQKAWKCTGFIYQGLLGGMAFLHLILMQTFFENSLKFVTNYCALAEIYTNVFSFLIAMCVISVFDKFDIAHVDFEHLRQIYSNHAKSATAIFLYAASFCLHQITYKMNDKLTLIHYKSANASVEEILKNSTPMGTVIDELAIWQKITVSKDILVVLAWLFISLGTQDDMLLTNLKEMATFAEDSHSG